MSYPRLRKTLDMGFLDKDNIAHSRRKPWKSRVHGMVGARHDMLEQVDDGTMSFTIEKHDGGAMSFDDVIDVANDHRSAVKMRPLVRKDCAVRWGYDDGNGTVLGGMLIGRMMVNLSRGLTFVIQEHRKEPGPRTGSRFLEDE